MYYDLHVMICSLKTLGKKIAYMEANTELYKWGGFVGVTSPYRETPHTAAIVMPIGQFPKNDPPIFRLQPRELWELFSINLKNNHTVLSLLDQKG